MSAISFAQKQSVIQNLGDRFQITCKHTKVVAEDKADIAAARKFKKDQNIFDEFTGFSETLYFSKNQNYHFCHITRREDSNSLRGASFKNSDLSDEFLYISTPGLTYSANLMIAHNEDSSKYKRISQIEVGVALRDVYFQSFPPIPCSIEGESAFNPAMKDLESVVESATGEAKKRIGTLDKSWRAYGIPNEGRQKLLCWNPIPGFVNADVKEGLFSPSQAAYFVPNAPKLKIDYSDWKDTPCGYLPTKIIVQRFDEDQDGFGTKKLVSREEYTDITYTVDKPSKEKESLMPFIQDGMVVKEPNEPERWYELKKEDWGHGDPTNDQKTIGTHAWIKYGFLGVGILILAPVIRLMMPTRK